MCSFCRERRKLCIWRIRMLMKNSKITGIIFFGFVKSFLKLQWNYIMIDWVHQEEVIVKDIFTVMSSNPVLKLIMRR